MPASTLQICSALPGRIRWAVPLIRDNAGLAAALERRLMAQPGVTSAAANPLTGRLLLRFPPEVPAGQAQGWLESALHRALTEPTPPPPPSLPPLAGDSPTASPLARLVRRTRQYGRLTNLSIAGGFFNRLFDATPPMMIGAAVDVVTRGPRSLLAALGFRTVGSQLVALGGFSALLWTLDAAVGYAQSVVAAELANNMRRDLRNEVYAHLQRLDVAQVEGRGVSEWMMVLNDDIEQVVKFVRDGLDPLVSVAAGGVVVATTFLLLSPAMSLTQFVLIPPLVIASSRMLPPIRRRYALARREAADVMAVLHANVSSMPTIASFATQDAEAARLAEATEAHRERAQHAAILAAAYVPTLQMIVGAGFVTTVGWGGWLVARGRLSPGAYNVLAYGDLRLLATLGRMGVFLDDLQRTQVALTRIFDVLDMQPSIVSGDRPLPSAEVRGEIRFEDVTFGYEPDRRIFRGLTLDFPAGATVGIVGVTGAGKTTLIKLIQRFYDVEGGAVRIDGLDVRDLRLEDLRRTIATVPQEISMFAGTIRENIAYGAPEASEDDIHRAARVAEAHAFIEALPDGYDTRVGFGGKTLSVGQRQRIAIARVVLANRPILLFDEATSALDHETEASVQRSLREITANRTTIIVAHRLSTIRDADRIYVLDEGEIRESGRHDELIRADGIYASLWRVQTGEALSRPKTP